MLQLVCGPPCIVDKGPGPMLEGRKQYGKKNWFDSLGIVNHTTQALIFMESCVVLVNLWAPESAMYGGG